MFSVGHWGIVCLSVIAARASDMLTGTATICNGFCLPEPAPPSRVKSAMFVITSFNN